MDPDPSFVTIGVLNEGTNEERNTPLMSARTAESSNAMECISPSHHESASQDISSIAVPRPLPVSSLTTSELIHQIQALRTGTRRTSPVQMIQTSVQSPHPIGAIPISTDVMQFESGTVLRSPSHSDQSLVPIQDNSGNSGEHEHNEFRVASRGTILYSQLL
jgi:hypothetical protein